MTTRFCLLVLSLIAFIGVPVLSVPPNPCPHVFRYISNPYGQIEGLINVPTQNGWMDLHVNASMRGYYGEHNTNMHLNMLTPAEELIVRRAAFARFQLLFPVQDSIPRITEIVLNGRIYCSGPPEPVMLPGPAIINMYANIIIQLSRNRHGSGNSILNPQITIQAK